MDDSDISILRPYKLVAVIMSFIAVAMLIVSVAGPAWMELSVHRGDVLSWGLWWDCLKAGDFKMCLQADWLSTCAALVMISLICMMIASLLGTVGLFTQKRLLYIIAGVFSVLSAVVQVISLIIYPVKFRENIKASTEYRTETQRYDLDWTYGIAWGAVFFILGAAILFLVHAETDERTEPKDSTPPPYYLNYTRA